MINPMLLMNPKLRTIIAGFFILLASYLIFKHNYLLFRVLVDIFTIIMASVICILATRAYKHSRSVFLWFLGNAYAFMAILNFLHLASNYCMGIFPGQGLDAPTQFWIAGRYVEAVSLLVAPLFVKSDFPRSFLFGIYFTLITLFLASILWFGNLPGYFIIGKGTNNFKIVSESVICLVILGAGLQFYWKRNQIDRLLYLIIMSAMVFTVLSEFSFIFNTDVYGFMNYVGHVFKTTSYLLICRAIVLFGLEVPYEVIFRDLKKERDFTSTVLDTAGALIVVLDSFGRIVRFNRACEQKSGYAYHEVAGEFFWDIFIKPEEVELLKSFFEPLQNSELPKEYTNFWVMRDGSHRLITWSITALLDDESMLEYVVCIGIDITERKKAEEKVANYQKELRALASELSLVEEQERRRIAEGIHDCIGQTLAVAKIQLGILGDSLSSAAFAEKVQGVRKLIEEAIQYTRTLTFELSPPILYDLGFEAAVEWLCEQTQERYGIWFSFEDDKIPKQIGNEIRVILFKAVKELLVNIVKHANARKVKVTVQKNNGKIKISVLDDGIGFDIPSSETTFLRRNRGFGLFSTRERLEHLGGKFTVVSKPGHGTLVSLEAPLKN